MEQVIKEYGKFLLDGIVMVALLVIIFTGITDDAGNRGALAIIGAKLEIENTNHKAYTDFRGTYQSESNKTAPVIAFIGTHLQSGICVVPDFVRAVDYAGNELPIKIISIIDESGAELISNYSQDTGKISFAPGIYTLSVSAEDGNNRTKNCTIQIPVGK